MKQTNKRAHVKSRFQAAACAVALMAIPSAVWAVPHVDLQHADGVYMLQARETTIKGVFDYIEQNSQYVFVYDERVRQRLSEPADVALRGADFNGLISDLCQKKGLAYEVSGRQVTISQARQTQRRGDQKTVSGVVRDADGNPLIGATVQVKGSTTQKTVTDLNGHYSLDVPRGAQLVVTYIGYDPTELYVGTASNYDVELREDTNTLNELVVIGYGQVRKKDLTGSVTAIKPDELNKGVQTAAQDALTGKIAGVNVVSNSGAPGSSSTIRIRSGASLSASNDPLIVIDGVPVDNSTIEGGGNIIGAINPNDIETFTVLKDASATAIYGSRASNGVIVITTKKGTDGQLRFNYNGNFSTSVVGHRLEPLTADEFRAFVPTITGVPSDIEYGTYNTDWQDEIYRTAVGTDHNFSVAGNAAKMAPFRASVGYTNQNGIIRTNNYTRYTFDGGITPSLLDNHLTVSLNLKASYENNRMVDGSVVNNALRYDPTRPVHAGSGRDGQQSWRRRGSADSAWLRQCGDRAGPEDSRYFGHVRGTDHPGCP